MLGFIWGSWGTAALCFTSPELWRPELVEPKLQSLFLKLAQNNGADGTVFCIFIYDFNILHKELWISAHIDLFIYCKNFFCGITAISPFFLVIITWFLPPPVFDSKHRNKSPWLWFIETFPQPRMEEVAPNTLGCWCVCVSGCHAVGQSCTAVGAAEQMTQKRFSGKLWIVSCHPCCCLTQLFCFFCYICFLPPSHCLHKTKAEPACAEGPRADALLWVFLIESPGLGLPSSHK